MQVANIPPRRSATTRTLRACLALALSCVALPARADFDLPAAGGEVLRVREWTGNGQGPRYLWLLNQYGESLRADALARSLADAGSEVWRVDLLEDLMLARSAESIRNLDGAPVAALIEAALRRGGRPVVLVACDRMAVPLLRGVRAWQEAGGADGALAGAVLFFPNLFKGTPVAGEAPEWSGIVAASNLPLVIVQPELGVNRERLPALLDALHTAGSPAYGWLVPGVRDYYLMQSERPVSESLQNLGGPVPRAVTRAIDATPALLRRAARLLAATPRASGPARAAPSPERAQPPAYGLIERPPRAAPGYALLDAGGRRHDAGTLRGRITLVNFWATWCPPCVHEIPSMNRLAAAYAPDEFAIVSVNFKEDASHVQAFMKRVAVDFPVLLDRVGAVSSAWRVAAFPSSFLVDREGRIRYSVNTAIEWDAPEVRAVIDRLRAEARAPGP